MILPPCAGRYRAIKRSARLTCAIEDLELSEETQSCPVPRQVFGQDGLQFLGRVVRKGCHRSQKSAA